jgi:excisionase family DNA binding protein
MEQDLLTATQVAQMLNVSKATVSRWTTEGSIPIVRLPRDIIRYRRSDIDKMLEPPASSVEVKP